MAARLQHVRLGRVEANVAARGIGRLSPHLLLHCTLQPRISSGRILLHGGGREHRTPRIGLRPQSLRLRPRRLRLHLRQLRRLRVASRLLLLLVLRHLGISCRRRP